MPFCCPGRTQKGAILVLNDLPRPVANALERHAPHVQRLRDPAFLSAHEDAGVARSEDLARVIGVAKAFARSGSLVTLDLQGSDMFQRLPILLAGVHYNKALIYQSPSNFGCNNSTLPEITQKLISFAKEFSGSHIKPSSWIAQLSRHELEQVIDRVDSMDDRVGSEVASLMTRFLFPVLGFNSSTTKKVYITPRLMIMENEEVSAPIVVQADPPKIAAQSILQLLNQAAYPKKSFSASAPLSDQFFNFNQKADTATCEDGPHDSSVDGVPCPNCLQVLQQNLLKVDSRDEAKQNISATGGTNLLKQQHKNCRGCTNFAIERSPSSNFEPQQQQRQQFSYIVSGGCGFIGSHLVDLLLMNGHKVTVVDNLTTGKITNLPESHPNLSVVVQDIMNYVPNTAFDGIFHLAATPAVQASWDHPLQVHENNLSATVAVIKTAKKFHIPRVVFASSAATYGNAEPPLTENQARKPISPYGLQKLTSEQYGRLFAGNGGSEFVACRFFNVYGPRQDPASPYSGVISLFSRLIKEGKPVTILGDGEQTRDFVFVKDVARVLAGSMQMQMTKPFQAMNVATGSTITVNQLASSLVSLMPHSSEVRIIHYPPRTGDIVHSSADVSRLMHLIGWRPSTPLDKGLKETVDWMNQ